MISQLEQLSLSRYNPFIINSGIIFATTLANALDCIFLKLKANQKLNVTK